MQTKLLEMYGVEPDLKQWQKSDAWSVMTQIMRIVGAFEFLLAFLYVHYIGFPEKHQAGLRLGVMQYALLALVSAYRVFFEPVGAKHKGRGDEIVAHQDFSSSPPRRGAQPESRQEETRGDDDDATRFCASRAGEETKRHDERGRPQSASERVRRGALL